MCFAFMLAINSSSQGIDFLFLKELVKLPIHLLHLKPIPLCILCLHLVYSTGICLPPSLFHYRFILPPGNDGVGSITQTLTFIEIHFPH